MWWWVLAAGLRALRFRARCGRGVAHADVARSGARAPRGREEERGDTGQDRVRSAALSERRVSHGDVRAERLGDPRGVPRRASVRGYLGHAGVVRVHAPVLRVRGGDGQDVRGPARRSRRARALTDRVVPGPCARRADADPDRAGQRAPPRQGAEAGTVRLRGGDPLDGRGRLRGRLDRRGREGADPFDLRVRRHDRARGHGASPGHRRHRGRQDASRRPGPRALARILSDPRLPRVARRREGRRFRQGRPESLASGEEGHAALRDHQAGSLRAGDQASRRALEGDAAREVPSSPRLRRARLGHGDRVARGSARGAGRERSPTSTTARNPRCWSSATAPTACPGRPRSTT